MVLSQLKALGIFIKWGVLEHIPVSDTISYADLTNKMDADLALLGMDNIHTLKPCPEPY